MVDLGQPRHEEYWTCRCGGLKANKPTDPGQHCTCGANLMTQYRRSN